jgi:hypothetical protein
MWTESIRPGRADLLASWNTLRPERPDQRRARVRVAETTVLNLSRRLYHSRIGSAQVWKIAPFVGLEASGLPQQRLSPEKQSRDPSDPAPSRSEYLFIRSKPEVRAGTAREVDH